MQSRLKFDQTIIPYRKVEPQRSDFYVGIEKNILTNATKGGLDLP